MQSAIRDLPRDAVLKVNVDGKQVRFSGISLTGEHLEPVENYNISYWTRTVAPETQFSFRMLPYYTKQMLMHCYFWIGFFVSLVIVLFVSLLRRKWKKSK
jgi:hypothetical protein